MNLVIKIAAKGVETAIILLVILTCAGNRVSGSEISKDTPTEQLINRLLSKDTLGEERGNISIEIFNRGEEVIPALLSSLESVIDDKEKLYRRFNKLIHMLREVGGSTQALKFLKPYLGGDKFTTGTEDFRINSMKIQLCTGLASLADPDCEKMFLDAFERTTFEEAVYTFGVSRNKKYLPILEKRLERLGGDYEDLQMAIYWVKVGPMPTREEFSDLQRVRQLIFEYMFIGSGAKKPWAIKLEDPERQEFTGYNDKLYYLKPGEDGLDLLKEKKVNGIVKFEKVIFNRDKTRAYTDLGYYWGGKSGRGYFFILEKIQGEWQLTFALPTWIA